MAAVDEAQMEGRGERHRAADRYPDVSNPAIITKITV